MPITAALAARLKAAAAGRPSNAPLLLWRSDCGWGVEPSANYRADFRAIVAAAGLDPAEVTAYALRHCSIVRMLLAGIPARLVASLHDTSVTEIERHYSKYISEGATARPPPPRTSGPPRHRVLLNSTLGGTMRVAQVQRAVKQTLGDD